MTVMVWMTAYNIVLVTQKIFKMKKSNSEVVIDPHLSNRKILLQRNPSLKSTLTHTHPDRQSNAVSLSKIKIAPKHHSLALPPHPYLKMDAQNIVFYGGDRVAQSINLQNIGKEILRINLALPRTKYFKLCEDGRTFTLPAGMSRKVMVSLSPTANFTDDSYCDQIIVQTENNKNPLRLQWFPRKPCLKYCPLIDLNPLDLGRQHKITIDFANESNDHTLNKVRLVKDAWDNIQITPDQFVLGPLKKNKVEVILYPQTVGAYHHKIMVQAEERLIEPIEITYAAIDYAFRIQNEKQQPVKTVQFGTLLRGTKKQITLYAHNNSPNQVQLKSKIKIGKSLKAQSTLQSPQELGIECSSTVIQLFTKTLRIAPFSRKKLILTTETQVEERHKLLVDRFARTQNLAAALKGKILQEQSQHYQILVCEFIDVNRKEGEGFVGIANSKNVNVTPMHAKFGLPLLKVNPNSLSLGQVAVGGTIQATISVQNLSSEPLSLLCGKLFSFDFFVLKNSLSSRQNTQIEVYLRGINIGSCHTQIQLLIAQTYTVKIPVQYEVINRPHQEGLYRTGFSSAHSNSQPTIDFNRTLLNSQAEKHRGKYERIKFRTGKSKCSQSATQKDVRGTQVFQSLRNSTAKGKELNTKQRFEGDAEDSCGLIERRESGSHGRKYNLFVTKKIDKYLPYEQLKQHKKLQKTRNNRDYFNTSIRRAPKNRKEAEEVARQLTPEQLKLVSINQKIISFGRLFIRSRAEREFIIGNGTEGALLVQLHQNLAQSKKHSSLAQSDLQPQIIGQNGAARLKVVFCALACGKFESTLSYTINGTHCFQLLVEAEVELVSLAISKTGLKMGYLDDVTEILLKDSFQLKNQGNTAAILNISQPNNKFVIEPESASIPAGESLTVWVMENNQNYPVIQAGETNTGKPALKATNTLPDDRILIRITDGNDISLKVTTTPGLSQPRCIVKQSQLNFGCTIVSKPKTKTFQLKNLSRNICLFQIFNQECQQFLTFDCLKGRIPPQGAKEITATYRSTLLHTLLSNFQILIRGGLIINVPIQAESVAPQVSIVQNDFNFGQLCCDTAAVRPISIKNQSETMVELFADLRSRQRGVQYLMISLWGSTSYVLGQKPKLSAPSYHTASFEEELIENAVRGEQGVQRIRVQAKSVLTFHLIFKPIVAGYYQFVLPLFLQNFIRNDSLSKIISCSAIEPKFVVQPSVIRFKKKIINDKQNSCFHPLVEYLTIRNPTDRPLRWKLDMHGAHKTGTSFSSYSSLTPNSNNLSRCIPLAPKLCFEIEQKRGELKGKESVSINVSFNPLEEGYYCHKVPLYIFSQQKGTYHQEAQIRLEGEGKYPSLYFNRRQLIMPVVPLGIQSISMLQVYNQGYESINLKHRFEIMDSEGNIHLSKGNLHADANFPEIVAAFPEGNKMGANKRQLFVIVKFMAKRSISFTCKLQLYDEATDCRTYSLPISGTADNSLLTNFSYLSDSQNIYRLEPTAGHLQQRKSKNREETTLISVALRTNDGRNLVDRYHSLYDEMTINSFTIDCRILKRWLNNFFREEKVRDFPGDLAGQLLLKLLYKLTGRKQFDGSWQYEEENGKQVLDGRGGKLTLYQTVLRVLKTMGCLLNHIRPYYLLQRQQFIQYMSKDSNWHIYADFYLKQHDLIFRQAWVVLLYQIVQHFWCARPKPDAGRGSSNVYSLAELQVLRWVKSIYEGFYPLEDSKEKFLSFGKDYKDCIAPIHCLLKYSIPPRKTKDLESLIRRPIAPQQFTSNTKILYQMLDKLNIVPLVYEDEYQLCHEKQIFLFMHQLYDILPQTYPRLPPLIFACQLGERCSRVIEIRNPSAKAVHYWVKLDGCRDFTYEDKQSIVIQPKSTYAFTVEYKSRLSSEQAAYISFFSKQEAQVNSINGSALVFQLRSKITGRKSIKRLDPISCPLYETTSLKVLVQNVFEDHEIANFSIQIIEEPFQNRLNNSAINKKIEPQHYDPLAMIQRQRGNPSLSKPPQFYCQIDSLKIKKGSASSFDLYFMPLRLGRTKYLLIFNDPNVGEFQYEIVGSAQIPKPLQQIKYQSNLFVGSKDTLQLNLPVYNSYMLKCESYFQQKCIPQKRNSRQKMEQRYRLQLNMDPRITQYITFPTQINLKNQKKDFTSGVDFHNRIRLQYDFPHLLKDLSLDFLLIGDPRRDIQDVRRFKVGLNVAHRPLQQELIMTTTARMSLCQPIPFENTSSKDWKVKVTILQNQNGWLSLKEGQRILAREIVVKKGQSQVINICFEPKWTGKSSGKMIIHNQTTNEQLYFTIKGVSQEPLSQDHFHLKVNNEDSTLFTIPITNPYHQRITYRILSDIQQLQLPPEITLESDESIQFNFIAQSISYSPLIGYIKFIDQDGRFFWYSLTVECAQRKVRDFWVQMTNEVGKQIQKVVEFKNPFNRQLFFKVEVPKDVGLQAKQQFLVIPHSTHQYKIKFRPLRPFLSEVVLKAFNKDIGSFIYHIKLTAKEQIRRRLYTMSVQVGKIGTLQLRLENGFKTSLKVNYHVSNPAYMLESPDLLLPNENICKLKFKPSSEGKQMCTLKVWGQHFPTKLFEIEGNGIAPYSIESISFRAHPNETSLQIIKFNNPNPKRFTQTAKVCLSQAEHGSFRIVGHQKDQSWQTEIKDLLVIPVQFQPKQKGYFQSVLTVQCFNYQWKYLLKGSTNFKENERASQEVIAICKEQVIKLFKIPIPEYIQQNSSYFDRVQVQHSDKKITKLLRTWIKLKLNNTIQPIQDDREERVVTAYLKFRPKKQLKQMVKLVLSNNSEQGPKITYNLQVTVNDCGPENVIPLEITTIKGIHFDIGLAGLGLRQAHVIRVSMGKGAYCEAQILPQHIRLKFKPNHLIFNRSRVYTENLLVESEQEQWNFEVQFTLKK